MFMLYHHHTDLVPLALLRNLRVILTDGIDQILNAIGVCDHVQVRFAQCVVCIQSFVCFAWPKTGE